MPHFPAGTCECGSDLATAADLGVVASHQQVEVPLASVQVIQHDLHAVACGCGRVHQAAPPAGAGAAGTVTYGLSVQAWCVFLLACHAIPVRPPACWDRAATSSWLLPRRTDTYYA